MSPKLTDAQKTARIAALLAETYPAPRYAPMWECAPSTGFSGVTRYGDLLVLQLWPSDGLELHGFEIKASKADLKRELADLQKHQALARYCDRWTLVTWDTAVVGTLELPEGWGWWTVDQSDEAFETHRRPANRTPEPWPRAFAASMIRRAVEQSPNADFTAAAVLRARSQFLIELESIRRTSDYREERVEADAHLAGWLLARGIATKPNEWTPEGRTLIAEWKAARSKAREAVA